MQLWRQMPIQPRKADYNEYMRKNPHMKALVRKPSPTRDSTGSRKGRDQSKKDKKETRSRDSSQRGRTQTRNGSGSSRSRTPSAGAQSTKGDKGGKGQGRATSIPPSKGCKAHILHSVLGWKACTRQPCSYNHPTEISEEDKKWAKQQQKGSNTRRNSPAAASPASSRSRSSSSGRKRRANKDKGQNDKGKAEGN